MQSPCFRLIYHNIYFIPLHLLPTLQHLFIYFLPLHQYTCMLNMSQLSYQHGWTNYNGVKGGSVSKKNSSFVCWELCRCQGQQRHTMVLTHIVCPALVNLIYTMKNNSLPLRMMQFIITNKIFYFRFRYRLFLFSFWTKLLSISLTD